MSLGKQDSSCFLLVTWIPGISNHYSCLPREFCTREFSGLLQCADVLLARTCLSRFHSFSSPLGQPVFMKIGQGGGGGGVSLRSLSSFIWHKLELVSLGGKLALKTDKAAEDSTGTPAAQGRQEIIRTPYTTAGFKALKAFHYYHPVWSISAVLWGRQERSLGLS